MTCSGLSPRNKVAYLVDPIGNKDIRFALDLALSVRREDQVRSIGGEHGKAIEGFVERDPLETGSVLVDDEEICVLDAVERYVPERRINADAVDGEIERLWAAMGIRAIAPKSAFDTLELLMQFLEE